MWYVVYGCFVFILVPYYVQRTTYYIPMHLLSLDIGTRRTGVAYGDTDHDFVMALDTIQHTSDEELVKRIVEICREKKIDEIIIGLPILLGGEEGSQAIKVRSVSGKIEEAVKLPVSFLDERYSSTSSDKKMVDAQAALELLQIALQRRRNGIDI